MFNTREQLKDTLSKLVSIPSQYPHEQNISLYCEQLLVTRGFKVEKIPLDSSPDRINLIATRGEKPKLMFYGHMDTVDTTKSAQDWDTNPFELTEKENYWYGLGAADMKGGIAAFLTATAAVDTPAKILLAVDEENISEGAYEVIKKRRDFFDGIELNISAEPSFTWGPSVLCTGRTGRSVYRVEFTGRAEHIALYKKADDAIKKLADSVHTFYEKRETLFQSPESMAQYRLLAAETKGMSVSDQAHAEIEALLGPKDTTKSALEALQKITDGEVAIKPRNTPYLQGYKFDSFPYQNEISEIILRHTGKEMTTQFRTSVGDDNVLAQLGTPVITWGADGINEHAPNEHVNADSLVKITEMYQELLLRLKK